MNIDKRTNLMGNITKDGLYVKEVKYKELKSKPQMY